MEETFYPAADLLTKLKEDIAALEQKSQLETLEKAMLLVAPEVAELGFEKYRSLVAVDREGANLMFMLNCPPATQWQPIVFLPAPDVKLDSNRGTISYTPLLGEDGWNAFQQLRSRNNMEG
jgi:hypothetical protein